MRTTLVLDKNDVIEAKRLGINISQVCRKALLLELIKQRKKVSR